MIELKPCPFCGSDLVSVEWSLHMYYQVLCWNCRASSCYSNIKGEDGIKEVVEAWNSRVSDTVKERREVEE